MAIASASAFEVLASDIADAQTLISSSIFSSSSSSSSSAGDDSLSDAETVRPMSGYVRGRQYSVSSADMTEGEDTTTEEETSTDEDEEMEEEDRETEQEE